MAVVAGGKNIYYHCAFKSNKDSLPLSISTEIKKCSKNTKYNLIFALFAPYILHLKTPITYSKKINMHILHCLRKKVLMG